MAKLIGCKCTQQGNSISDRNHFVARFDSPPTDEEVAAAQNGAGYNPAGYGGPWDVKTKEVETSDGKQFETTFTCSSSCD